MYFLSWIIVGLVVGWSAGKILKGNGYGPLDIAMGICGAVAGGFFMRSAGLLGGHGGIAITTLVAMFGAVLLTLLAGFVNGRKVYTRQL